MSIVPGLCHSHHIKGFLDLKEPTNPSNEQNHYALSLFVQAALLSGNNHTYSVYKKR